MKEIIFYKTIDNKCPFLEWYNSLDKSIRLIIDRRIDRIKLGNLGDYKRFDNLTEIRFKEGAGYRIYTYEYDEVVIIFYQLVINQNNQKILSLLRNIYKNLLKGINNMDIEKIKSENITHEEHMNKVLQDEEYQKMYLDTAIQEFITDGDYDLFFQSLEQVIKARMSVSEFSQKTGITRTALYEMFKGERVPRLDTIGKLLKELGYTLHIA